jgi:hypothetical protein
MNGEQDVKAGQKVLGVVGLLVLASGAYAFFKFLPSDDNVKPRKKRKS